MGGEEEGGGCGACQVSGLKTAPAAAAANSAPAGWPMAFRCSWHDHQAQRINTSRFTVIHVNSIEIVGFL